MPTRKPRPKKEPWDADRAPMFHRNHYKKSTEALRAMLLNLTEPPVGTRVVAHSFPSEWRGVLPKNTLKPRLKGTRAAVLSVRGGVATVELHSGETARVPVMYLRPLRLEVGDYPVKLRVDLTVDGESVDAERLGPTLRQMEAARAELSGFFKQKRRPKTEKVTGDNIELGSIVLQLRDKEGDRLGVVRDPDKRIYPGSSGAGGPAALVVFGEDEEKTVLHSELELVRGSFPIESPMESDLGYDFILTHSGDLLVGCQYVTIHQVRDLVKLGDRITGLKKLL